MLSIDRLFTRPARVALYMALLGLSLPLLALESDRLYFSSFAAAGAAGIGPEPGAGDRLAA